MSAPRRWFVLSVRNVSGVPHVAELLPEALRRVGVSAAQEEEGSFMAYLPELEEPEAFLDEARREIEGYTGSSDLDLSWRWQEHEEWGETWKRGFVPRRVGGRLLVSPSWVDAEPAPGELLITLDPGVAFGTGEHPTTRSSLRILDRVAEPGTRWADVGSGSGILSIALVRFGAAGVVAVEPDPLACRAAEENFRVNGVEDVVEVVMAEGSPELLERMGPLDGIVANIESGVILPLLPSFRAALVSDGRLVVSGILLHEAEGILDEARATDFRIIEEEREENWWTAHFRAAD